MYIKAVIFDMDGLMLDPESLYRAACQQAAAEFGYRQSDAVSSQHTNRNTAEAEQVLLTDKRP